MVNPDSISFANEIEKKESFSEVLSSTTKEFSEKIMIISETSSWTYSYFNKSVNCCCNYFNLLDLKRGDIVTAILKNSIDFLIIYFACLRMKLIVNPFPVTISPQEIIEKFKIYNPKIIFCENQNYNSFSRENNNVVNVSNINGKSFQKTILECNDSFEEKKLINKDETAILYYSSGTTGNPKLIEYTHKSMIRTQASMIRAQFCKKNSVHLCILPLGHTAALRYTIKPCVAIGGTVILYESFWKIRSGIWDEVEKYKPSFMQLVPSILMAMVNTPYKNFKKRMAESLDFIGCGSSFLSKKLQDQFEKKFGITISNLYGLSELGATHFDDPKDSKRKKGSIGRGFDIVKTIIIDEKNNEINRGEIGEIAISTPGALKNYFDNHKFYKSCFVNNYFKTGDLGYIDKDGYCYYVDRKKDIIIKGGVNIAPTQIDDVLISHPSIMESASIGVPDSLFGETIKSFIVLKEKVDINIIKKYCQKNLGMFKTPSYFTIVQSLPKNASQKILKRKLREI